MKDEQKIHILTQELIPLIDDVDAAAKNVMLEHIETCSVCQKLYQSALNFDDHLPTLPVPEQSDIKPLKKLAQFNRGLKWLMVIVRAIILFYIVYTNVSFMQFTDTKEELLFSIQSMIYLFYVPAIVFLTVFTMTFFNKKWFWLSLGIDLFIILFLIKILQFIV